MARFDTTIWGDLAEARAGGQAAGTLLDRYRPPLVAYLRGQGICEADAEDLVQEVFLRFFDKELLSTVDQSQGRFRSYLLAVTRHVLTDWRRRSRALKRGGGQDRVPLEELPAQEPAPDEAFERCWLGHLLKVALAAVERDHPDQHVLLVGTSEGRSPQDLAAELGKDPGAVRVALHRARKRMAEHLKREVAAYCATENEYAEEIARVLGRAASKA